MAHLFTKFFPTPRFLKMPAVGLDISDQSIHFVELVPQGEAYVLGRFGEKKIPAGAMESGKIKDFDGLKKALAGLAGEFGLSFVNVSLPEEQAYMAKMSLPPVRKRELRESISLQLEEYIPLKVEESVFDYEVLAESEKGYELQVSALPRSIAENYLRLFSGTGLTPLVFEIEAQAIARAVVPNSDKRTRMLIDFGGTRTGLAVVSDNVVVFTSTLDIGGRTLDTAIEKTFNVEQKEAERLKKEFGLLKNSEKKDLSLTLMHPVSVLKDEVNRLFVYWHTHREPGVSDKKKIENIILCGGDSNLLGFTDYMSANLKVPVSTANVWINVNSFNDYIPELPFEDSLRYATAIGLSLGSIQ